MSSEKKSIGGSSSFPFTSQLFGTNDSSSNDIFSSIFSSNSFQVGGRSQAFSSNSKSEGNNSKYKEEKNDSRSSEMNSIYEQHQTITHPCHFSSSIYYGGQDVYNTPETQFNSSLKKLDDGEDDSSGAAAAASRGNWWQGSLYY